MAPTVVQHRIAALDDPDGGRLVASKHPAVIAYTHRVFDARNAHARKFQPARPVPKPGGGKRRSPSPRTITCPTCNGTGEADDGMSLKTCPQCKGMRQCPAP